MKVAETTPQQERTFTIEVNREELLYLVYAVNFSKHDSKFKCDCWDVYSRLKDAAALNDVEQTALLYADNTVDED